MQWKEWYNSKLEIWKSHSIFLIKYYYNWKNSKYLENVKKFKKYFLGFEDEIWIRILRDKLREKFSQEVIENEWKSEVEYSREINYRSSNEWNYWLKYIWSIFLSESKLINISLLRNVCFLLDIEISLLLLLNELKIVYEMNHFSHLEPIWRIENTI